MKQLQELKALTNVTGASQRETFLAGLQSLSKQVASFKQAHKNTAKLVRRMAPARIDSMASEQSSISSIADASSRGVGNDFFPASCFAEETSADTKVRSTLPGQNNKKGHQPCFSDARDLDADLSAGDARQTAIIKRSKVRFSDEINASCRILGGVAEEPTYTNSRRNLSSETCHMGLLPAIPVHDELVPLSSDAGCSDGEQQV